MSKNNIVLTFFSFFIFASCATYDIPLYKDKQSDIEIYPKTKNPVKTFYLVGDAGYAQMGESTVGLKVLKNYLDSVENNNDHFTLFLGDNIYPEGMPPKESESRALSEYRLDIQYNAVKDYKGEVIFIPGNHDWYNHGVEGLQRQEKYFQSKLKDKKVFLPEDGCPLVSYDIDDEVHMIIIDTQWYLEDWDKNPKINDKCNIKTREKFFLELEGEIKKNQEKTVLIAMHHPMYTNGVHGGKFAITKHLFPSQKKIPIPIFASLITQIRTQGGISKQDRYNEKYNELMKRLKVLIDDHHRIIFASGHEHSLQYIEHDEVKQIISGSGSKASYAVLGGDGLFAYSGQGFAVLDIFKEGETWVRYFGSGENNQPKLVYTRQIFQPVEEPKIPEAVVENLPKTVKTSIYSIDETKKSELFESIWGEHYRNIYGKQIEAKVALLDTLYGGLEVVRPGGGHQTVSLRLKDKKGRDYNMRALRKSAVQFIQTSLMPDNEIEEDLRNTVTESIVQDFYTAAHPYGALAIPKLSEAIKVFHTNPKLYYIPKQPALGKYSEAYGDQLYLIVERPEKEYDGAIFNYPDDIESTDDILDKIRSDEENVVDEQAYIRARIFDMLIGDWDRHNDQWRWAEFKNRDGKDVYVPIPRDRDQVFTNFDGALLDVARTLFDVAAQFQVYDENLRDIKWFNNAGIKLDRALTQNSTREVWITQAQFIQDKITDELIETAFLDLPEEVRTGSSIEEIKKNLRGRRKNIVDITGKYFDYFAKLQMANGTDKDDFFEIIRGDNETTIKIYRIKDGEKGELILDRKYYSNETNEIWVYGLDDDDVFEVKGHASNPIFIRIIGGQNNDTYRIENGRKLKIYDHRTLENTVERKGGANFKFTNVYDYNTYLYQKQILRSNAILPLVGYNPDNGVSVGLRNIYTVNSFRQDPFSQKHNLGVQFYFATSGIDIKYEGEFAGVFNLSNLFISARFTTPNFTQNFFGYGNETINEEDSQPLEKDYNRVRISRIEAAAGVVRNSDYGSIFKLMGLFQGVEVEDNENRFVENYDVGIEDRKFFGTVEASYDYHSSDNRLVPTRGMDLNLKVGFTNSVGQIETNFGYGNALLGFYNALSKNRKWVLKSQAQGQLRIGDEYEFYQAASLGQNTGLRGYRFQRFIGKRSFATSTDLRYSFNKFKTRFLPLQIGIFAGYDLGRVWLDDDPSNVWHDSYGLGLWINSANTVNGTFNFFNSDDGFRMSFGFGVNF